MNTITCPQCNHQIEVDKALEGQIEARVLAAEHKKHEAELAKVKERAAELANQQLRQRLELEAAFLRKHYSQALIHAGFPQCASQVGKLGVSFSESENFL